MKKKDRVYKCVFCESIIPFKGYSYNHKYCDNACQAKHRSANALQKYSEYFEQGVDVGRPRQRKILTKRSGYACSVCNIFDWQGKKLVLQVDHIDGNAENNQPENLRLICPNCHSQTKTFAGANRGQGRWSKGLKKYYEGHSFTHGKTGL